MLATLAPVFVLLACGRQDDTASGGWAGIIDTLPSGQVVVHNPDRPIWGSGEGWRVAEELRIGRMEGEGPDLFGRITSIEVDGEGRIWVLEQQSHELRVFSGSGTHVRTIGRQGGGPGEFAQAVHVQQGPDGHIWVMDPQNSRLSVFDTAGAYLESHSAPGGFVVMPWPGGFDARGNYYAPVPQLTSDFRIALVRHDSSFVARDTLSLPVDPTDRDQFTHRSPGGGRLMAGIPYQGGLSRMLSDNGTMWALLRDEYRLFELSPDGDTLRAVTRDFEPLPVTAEDRDRAREDLKWFTDQGGRIDLSRLPDTKPPVRGFFLGEDGTIWVELETEPAYRGRRYDIFDSSGRFLGPIELPFRLLRSPRPVVRRGSIYGVTEDDLGVQYVVRGRIAK